MVLLCGRVGQLCLPVRAAHAGHWRKPLTWPHADQQLPRPHIVSPGPALNCQWNGGCCRYPGSSRTFPPEGRIFPGPSSNSSLGDPETGWEGTAPPLPHLPHCCRALPTAWQPKTRSGRAWRPRASFGSPGLQLTTQPAGDQGSFSSGYLSFCFLVSAVLGTGNGFVQWEVTGN